MYKIGDLVYYASVQCTPKEIPCPDCLGNRYLTVTLGDKTLVTVDCPECERGWRGSLGTVTTYDYLPHVDCLDIIGVEKEKGELFYHLPGYWRATEVFSTQDEAENRAKELVVEYTENEAKRLKTKEKPTKTWAWNATYHRSKIRQAEKDLIYHKSKLDVANSLKKIEK